MWCEEIVLGPELQLARGDDHDHLLVSFEQDGHHGTKVTLSHRISLIVYSQR